MTMGTEARATMKPAFGPRKGENMRSETVKPTYAPSM